MFSWNIAKSAEAMFSRWAIKKVFKFLLKKKLGQFILGDIDLNQLDVQLRNGTVQLSDLALNVDYINLKLGALAGLTVKEGSIGSLSVTMPWKSKGCQIELDELEIVLGPGGNNLFENGSGTSLPSRNVQDGVGDFRTSGPDIVDNTVAIASVDVHEGVKTIAKMVKWLLTSFHVRIKKLIVAFDPYLEEKEKNGFCRTLVLRIAEVECGTGTSEVNNSDNQVKADTFLGFNRLTNFVKFHGAILEFFRIDDCVKQSAVPCSSGTTSTELFNACCSPNATTSIITGEKGGFSGTMKLSIPWKNGSLDIRKVDADVSIDPLELRIQPSSIKCLLHLFEVYGAFGENGKSPMHNMDNESVYHNAISNSLTSTLGSYTTEKVLSNHGYPSNINPSFEKDPIIDTLLPGSHVISDWVTSSSRKQRDNADVEPDFGASVDQFFECFDELRTSQSALGNSGMWNWTCSVFSAITAASNLESGSLHIPTEQKHVETNLKANIAGVTLLFSFVDEDLGHLHNQTNARPCVHYLGAKFQNTLFILQVCPREMNIKATVEHFELSDHFSSGNDINDSDVKGYHDDIKTQVTSIAKMQSAVEVSFPTSSLANYYTGAKATNSVVTDSPYTVDTRNDRSIYRSDVVKVILLRTSGVIDCLCTVTFGSSSLVMGATSFSLKLPPFVFWVNFRLISLILDVLKQPGDSVGMPSTGSEFLDETCDIESSSSSQEKLRKKSCSQVTSSSPAERLKGNVLLSNARIILCFPYETSGDLRSYTCWNQFIAVDISSAPNLREEKVQVSSRPTGVKSKKWQSMASSCSLHLNFGNLGIYLITAASTESIGSDSGTQNPKYLHQKIVSVADQASRFSVLSMFWQDDYLTGPWIAKKARLLATSGDSSRREKSVGCSHDVASVTAVIDVEGIETINREEIILSSSFILHAHVAPVMVMFGSSQYKTLNSLISEVIDWLSCLASNSVDGKVESFAPQTSMLVECDFLEFQVKLEADESIKGSPENELPGCWHSFKLQIQKLELLSVSNVGGISDSKLFWLGHGMGNLWGSITSVPAKEFLLISCNNATRGRGDGDGSNVLSSKMSGSDIVHFWDSVDSHSHTSVTIRSGTMTAVGGRLDWLNSVTSFFSLPSPETEQLGDDNPQKVNSDRNGPCVTSFVVNLIDIGLGYEPYLGHLAGAPANEKYFGCLLAASSFSISNSVFSNSPEREYRIRVQELGLLICPVSGLKSIGSSSSVQHLRRHGYIKVAQEAHIEALLRMNCINGHLWEFECTESHIILNTCHDTFSALICLSAQLQQLFAPDVEESIVHLQNRWNNIQHRLMNNEMGSGSCESSISTSQVNLSHGHTKSMPGVVNLMDEICENAFQLNQYGNVDPEYSGLKTFTSFEADCPESTDNIISKDCPEFIEEYFFSDVLSPSGLSSEKQPVNEVHKNKPSKLKGKEVQRRKSGWYNDVSLEILENHVSEICKQAGLKQTDEHESSDHTKVGGKNKVEGNVILKNINVTWRMCAGSSWQNFQNSNQNLINHSGSGTIPYLELSLFGLELKYDRFPHGGVCVSKLSISVLDFRLDDNSKDAPWKLILGYYHSKDHPRESSSKALKLNLDAVRPHPSTPLEEYRLRIGLLPILLHLHQRQLDFLISFFGEKDPPVDPLPSSAQYLSEPILQREQSVRFGSQNINEEALLPYFQKFEILPVTIRVDYSPCHVDLAALSGGKYVELVNLFPWKGVELQLKRVQGKGVYGWSCICETIIGEWLEDISQNQVRKLLKGLPPIRSLVAVGSGAAKLVSLPVKNYKKDHRILKGMQRGTIAFLRSISVEAIGLGVHLAAGTHEIFMQAEYILANIPPSVPWPSESKVNSNVRSNQPSDARQGIRQAYESISDGLGKSAAALVQSPLKRYQRGAGVGSALATAVQAAPAAAIAPVSAVARAAHCALLGVRNSLDLERKKESMDKYSGTPQPM
ncbi:hypothetical protein ACET3Z_022042 [Daucus carota]